MKKTFYNDNIRRMQRRHVLLYAVFPVVVTLGGLIAGVPFTKSAGFVIIIMWLFTSLGVSVGFHRLFTHRAFKTSRPLSAVLAVAGMMAAPGPVLSWVANHRMHHQHSDKEGDPHSPNLGPSGILGKIKGLWHAHYGWMVDHPYANPLYYCPDLVKQEWLRKLCRYYDLWVWLGLLLPAAIYFALFHDLHGVLSVLIYGGFFRLFVVYNIISSVNSIGHVFGQRPFATPDHSRNNIWVALFAVGEGWHNNHHAMPQSAYLGHTWWQIDAGAWLIRILSALGLVWDVKTPDIAGPILAEPASGENHG